MASSKVFIITGASKGIGAAVTQRLLSQQHKLVLGARSEDLLASVKKSHPQQVEYVAGDMTDQQVSIAPTPLAALFFLFQAKAGLGELRKSGGCIVWVSSGASVKPYAAWAAYGSSKAAINSIAAQLAVEEPNITTIAIAPGRVDTDMQAVIRASGKKVMEEAQYNSFSEAFHQGKLLKPEQPGHVIANLVANAQKDLTGKFLK